MRIIGGTYKGHFFNPPNNIPARPTTDIAKEALFNILNNHFDFENIKVLDLFGGTGSISYEFASRGCTDITLVELDRRSVDFIKETAKKMNFNIQILKKDVFSFIKTCTQQYDLIFAGPPYPLPTLNTLPNLITQKNMISEEGWHILEHNPHHNFDKHAHFLQKRNYGTTIFSFFTANINSNIS